MNKEREAFNLWLKHYDSHEVKIDQLQRAFMWQAWQAAKAQALPNQPPQFNLDEFLTMEEKLKHKVGVITADLDRFIAYAEMVLEKAKALKEPK